MGSIDLDFDDLSFSTSTVLVVGDIMLDRYVYGDVSRISPEAPAPVLDIRMTDEIVGGAGNVAANIASLGAACKVIGVVGADNAGAAIRRKLAGSGVFHALIEVPNHDTTVKTRYVADLHNTHMLRADSGGRSSLAPGVGDAIVEAALVALPAYDAVILSDYAKGVLSDKVISEIIHAANKANKLVVVNPKGLDFARYNGARVIVPNTAELAGALHRTHEAIDRAPTAAALELLTRGFKCVVVTRGDKGLAVVHENGAEIFSATAKRVIDVSGAGDTVVAAFTLAAVIGENFVSAAKIANTAAGLVVAKRGTARCTAAELRTALRCV